MKPNLSQVLIAISCVLLSACDRQQVPEAYGTYIRDGETLVRFNGSNPASSSGDFSAKCSIIIFDRGMDLQAPIQTIAKIYERRYVRFNILTQIGQSGNQVVDKSIKVAGDFIAMGNPVPVLICPLKGHSDMIEIKPQIDLSKGLYYVEIYGLRFPFSVGIGKELENKTPFNKSMDRYAEVRSANAAFSWDAWLSATQSSGGDNSTYRETAAFDAMIPSYKSDFQRLLGDGRFLECAKISEILTAYQGGGAYPSSLIGGLCKAAESQINEFPHVAIALSNRALAIDRDSSQAMKIHEDAVSKLNLWNENQIKSKEAWEKLSTYESKIILRTPYVERRVTALIDQEHPGWLELAETSISRNFFDYGEKKGEKIQFTQIAKLDKYSEKQSSGFRLDDSESVVYHGIEITATGGGVWKLDFKTQGHRDQIHEILSKCVSDFNAKFDPSKNEIAGDTLIIVEKDVITYAIDISRDRWSSPVRLPTSILSWSWNHIGDNGGWLEVLTKDGKVIKDFSMVSGPVAETLKFRVQDIKYHPATSRIRVDVLLK